MDELADGEVKNLIPGLADRPWFAAVMRDKHGHVSDPGRLVKDLARFATSNGADYRQARATGFVLSNGMVSAIKTDSGDVPVDMIVIAAGAWSGDLVRQLGVHMPLESERGYHADLTNADTQLRFPVMWTKGKCVFTPMDMGLRVAGTVEFAGLDAPANPQRPKLLLKHSKTLFPHLRYDGVREWLGHRPTLTDSLPAIGRLLRHRNIILALGHHHLGLMAGPMTGRLVAELISGRPTSINLAPYAPDRF